MVAQHSHVLVGVRRTCFPAPVAVPAHDRKDVPLEYRSCQRG